MSETMAFDIEITIECSGCGQELEAKRGRYESVLVDPCPHCEDDQAQKAYEAGYEAGRSEGYDAGYEEASSERQDGDFFK